MGADTGVGLGTGIEPGMGAGIGGGIGAGIGAGMGEGMGPGTGPCPPTRPASPRAGAGVVSLCCAAVAMTCQSCQPRPGELARVWGFFFSPFSPVFSLLSVGVECWSRCEPLGAGTECGNHVAGLTKRRRRLPKHRHAARAGVC